MKLKPLQFNLEQTHFGQKLTENIYSNKEERLLGEIELYLINADKNLKGYVDQYRGEVCYTWEPMNIFQNIEYGYDHCFIRGKVAYLSMIKVQENFRGKGIGTDIMNQLIAILTNKGYDYLILQPSPLISSLEAIRAKESLEEKRLRYKLYNFYSQFGFYRVPTQEELNFPIYYKGLQDDFIRKDKQAI